MKKAFKVLAIAEGINILAGVAYSYWRYKKSAVADSVPFKTYYLRVCVEAGE